MSSIRTPVVTSRTSSLPPSRTPRTLLSFPDELIIQISHAIAPNGGKKVANLRLVHRRFAELALPVLLSALVIPRSQEIHESRLASIGRGSKRFMVKEVNYCIPIQRQELSTFALARLVNLTRLHISHYSPASLPTVVGEVIKDFPQLKILHFTNVQLSLSTIDFSILAPTVNHLILEGTWGQPTFFFVPFQFRSEERKSPIRILDLRATESTPVTAFWMAIDATFASLQTVSVSWRQAPGALLPQPPRITSNAVRALRIHSLPDIVTVSDVTAVNSFIACFSQAVNFRSLSLNVSKRSIMSLAPQSSVVVQNIHYLELVGASEGTDFLDTPIYRTLLSFTLPFRNLSHLHLRDWILPPSRSPFTFFELSTPAGLAASQPLVSALLTALSGRGLLTKISFASKEGNLVLMFGRTHPDVPFRLLGLESPFVDPFACDE
ncbi:hypothetical protein T439DRAFT_328117 [Meredithblackwellia eburnea MCA 4105]